MKNDKRILVILVMIVVIIIMQGKKEAGVGICLVMEDCSQYSVDSWIYKNPDVGPSALGSCCKVSEEEPHSICTGSGFTELYQECIQPIIYQDFISYKNSYLLGDSFENFISNANQWVM